MMDLPLSKLANTVWPYLGTNNTPTELAIEKIENKLMELFFAR